MSHIEPHQIRTLFEHVAAQAPELVPACRRLVVEPQLASWILGEDAPRPTTADLCRLAGVLETVPPEGYLAGQALLSAYRGLKARVDVSLERLLAAGEDEWSHPAEILGRPCPDFAQLLAACATRAKNVGSDHCRHLESVRHKLERAVRLEAKAHRRRSG